MPLITLLSDYGDSDHYVAAVKAKILTSAPEAVLIDISHQIKEFNLPHAAYLLKAVFRDFPKGTIHLVAVNSPSPEREKFIGLKLEDHYFLGMDNGLLSLLSDHKPQEIVELKTDDPHAYIFSGKIVLAPAAAAIANGTSLTDLGSSLPAIRIMFNRQLRLTHNQIIGHVIHIDHYGNLVTNIGKKEFETVGMGRAFSLNFSRESLDSISQTYFSRDNADCVAIFNSSGFLEIALTSGNASELLGMKFDSPVMINFS